MNLSDLERCLLSTTPFVSLRTEDNEMVARATQSPVFGSYHFLALVERNGVVGLWAGNVGERTQKSALSHGQLLDYLSKRIPEETGTTWKVLSYSQDLLLSTHSFDGVATTQVYVGTILVAIVRSRGSDVSDFSLQLLDIVEPTLEKSLRNLTMEILPGQPHIANPNQQSIDDALRLAARLTQKNSILFATAVKNRLGLSVEEYCQQQPEAAYLELTTQLAVSPEIKRVDLGWSEAWSDHKNMNRTFSTETSGNELRTRSGLEAAALLSYHTIFIVLPPTALMVSPNFIKGLLKESIMMEGGLAAFWNRYKFIGWEKFMSILQNTVTQLYHEHATKRN